MDRTGIWSLAMRKPHAGHVVYADNSQTGGSCLAFNRAVINVNAEQTGGNYWAYDRAVINSKER